MQKTRLRLEEDGCETGTLTESRAGHETTLLLLTWPDLHLWFPVTDV